MTLFGKKIMLDPDGEAADVLRNMIRAGERRVSVVKDTNATGRFTRGNILNLLEIKTDLAE